MIEKAQGFYEKIGNVTDSLSKGKCLHGLYRNFQNIHKKFTSIIFWSECTELLQSM